MSSFDPGRVLTANDFYNFRTRTGYLVDKYRGRIIQDPEKDLEIEVEDIYDLRFEDLDFEDQKAAVRVGWAWGVSDHADLNKCKIIKAYLFRPKQFRFFWGPERFPAYFGAFGSGKSLIIVLKGIWLSLYYPGTRGLLMRATYPQLMDTTIATMFKVFNYFGWKSGELYNHHISRKLIELYVGNKKSEILYRPAKNEGQDIQAAIEDLQSLEIDWAGIDEIVGVEERITMAVRNRVGRWGVIGRSEDRKMMVGGNPPSEGTWIHKRWWERKYTDDSNIQDPQEHSVYASSAYENRRNLPKDYIEALEASPEYWRNSFLYGRLGFIPPDGEPIYKNFNYNLHVSEKPLEYNKKLPLLRGWDIGPTAKNKACVVAQLDSRGVLIILAEFMMLDPGVVKFGEYVQKNTQTMFPEVADIKDFTDPVAFHVSQTDGQSPAGLLRKIGIHLIPGEESFQLRHDAVVQTMDRLIDGVPGILIDRTRCPKIVEAMMGGYRYKIIDLPNERFSREPIKDVFSHCLSGDALVSTPNGLKRIDRLNPGESVKTPNGTQVVSATMNQDYTGYVVLIKLSNGNELRCTANHPIYTARGIVRADALCYNDMLWDDQEYTNLKTSMESDTTANHRGIISPTTTSTVGHICTAMYGYITMAGYLKNTTSIMLTGINQTIRSRIWSWFQPAVMQLIMPHQTILNIQSECSEVSLLLGRQPELGTDQKRGWGGIENTEKKHGRIGKRKSLNVLCVGSHTKHSYKDPEGDFANLIANRKPERSPEKMTLRGFVLSAEKDSGLTNTSIQRPVVRVVGLKVKKERLRVYDLTVENEHCFYANGVLVGNCMDAMQYICSRLAFITRKKRDDSPEAQRRRESSLYYKRRKLLGQKYGTGYR